ncbi:hypothetical protein, partial [Salinicola aestuarinus]|uniref:hypothetical protein n=1 Tax=Salinicola aestuarinus TaxID=1949082 RepID=UPI001CB6F336
DLSPPHEDFPGEVKGWPEPSTEYRNKIIMRRIEINNGDLRSFKKGLEEKDGTPQQLESYRRHIESIREENAELKGMLR